MNYTQEEKQFGIYRPYLWLGILCVCTFFIWASLTEIDQQVRGVGKVIPSGKMRAIQHLEGGIIKGIYVHEGQTVNEGESLFQLTNMRAQSEMREIEVARQGLQIKQIRLQAELENKDSFEFPLGLLDGNAGIGRSEQSLFASRRAEYNEKVNGLQKRMSQKVLKLDDLETNIKNLEKENSIAKEQLAIRSKLLKTGAMSRSQYLDTESAVKNFNTRISKLQKEIPIIKSELAEIANLLEETKQGWRSKVIEELNEVNIHIKKLNERITTYSDTVERTEVHSPIKGVVSKIHINTIGGVIQPGQTIAEIIPIEETLVVEGRISTEDRGKIWVGLPVVSKITAYDYSIYGGIKGALTYISADSFIDNQNRQYYQVRVELERAKLSDDKPVFPGMAVEINILANKISVLDSILKPLYQIRDNALREL